MMRFLYVMVLVTMGSAVMGQQLVKEFFDKNDRECKEADSYYHKVGKKATVESSNIRTPLPNGGYAKAKIESYVDTVKSYYTKDNVLRSQEFYNAEGVLEGRYLSYHENGKVNVKTTYSGGRPLGHYWSWYPDGKPHEVLVYSKEYGKYNAWPPIDYAVVSYWDATGRQVVVDGNGFCECFQSEQGGQTVIEKGRIRNGVRDSVWVGMSDNSAVLQETYRNGKLESGIRGEYSYTSFEEQAKYPGGFAAMAKFLSENLRYPAKAARKGTSGEVMIRFVVDKDGSIINTEVEKGIQPEMDAEALRVVNLMPKWIPGLQRGIPIKSRFHLPVNFKS